MPLARRALIAAATALAACSASVPEGIVPVRFDAQRYLGTWYEIARFDHSFERDLERVSATYAANPDGSIAVLNRGFDPAKGDWREAKGRARFLGARDVASLGVTFQPPFEGGYNVFRLAPDYSIALVTGNDRSYLWLLSRTPTLPEATVAEWLAYAQAQGFATERVIRVRQP